MPKASTKKKPVAKPKPSAKPSLTMVGQMYRIRGSVGASFKKQVHKQKQKRPPVKHVFKPLPKTWSLIKEALSFAWHNRRALVGPVIVYGVAHIFLVSGFSGHVDASGIQKNLEQFVGNHPLGNSLITTGIVAIGAANQNSENPSGKVYQALLPIMGTLVFIWVIRRAKQAKPIKLREAFYFSMQPFFPLVLVLLSVAIRLVPLIGISYVMAVAKTGGFAASGFETALFVVAWVVLSTLCLMWVAPYVLAIYGVSLPQVYPGQATRGARAMAKGQRLALVGRMMAGVGLGLLIGALLIFLCIIWLPSMVVPLTLWLQFSGLMLLHVYFYHIYRSIL